MGGLLGGIQHPVGVDFAALLLLAHLFPPRGALGPGDVTQGFPLLALAHLHGAFTQTAAPHQAALHLGLEIWRGEAMEGRWQVWKELPWSLVYVPDHWSHVSPPKLPAAGRAQLGGGVAGITFLSVLPSFSHLLAFPPEALFLACVGNCW